MKGSREKSAMSGSGFWPEDGKDPTEPFDSNGIKFGSSYCGYLWVNLSSAFKVISGSMLPVAWEKKQT